jgi:16S rRNA (guanine966-N2)-methyltransferase
MRIVGGRHKGARLAAPATSRVRPTSDRTREAVFNILAHGIEDFDIDGVRVLDLFAGTGALGLEALSRGARFCLFVEESADSRALIRRNVETLGLTGVTRIFRRDATRLGPAERAGPFDLVFADPPYGLSLGETALASAREGGWLAAGAVVVVEESADAQLEAPEGFAAIDCRTYGDTQVVFLRAEAN